MSIVNREMLSVLGIRHVKGQAFTPRHQGPGERAHQRVTSDHLVLMNELCACYPQEWPVLVPVLEYLCETAPREPHGLSALDLTQGYALLVNREQQESLFHVPDTLPETEVARKMFREFRDAHGIFSRHTADDAQRKMEELNKNRAERVFAKGEIVFRRLAAYARPNRHLLGDKCSGPFVVVSQGNLQSVVLKDASTGQLVDEGKNIPLDQVLAAPRRHRLLFDYEEGGPRSIGQMLRGEDAPEVAPGRVVKKQAKERVGEISPRAAMSPTEPDRRENSEWVRS